jgi:ATP-dependent helicase HrpB
MSVSTLPAFDLPLPIDEALPALTSALASGRNAVLVAPPGAGKTTRVPLVLLDSPWRGDGRILMLEPRRLAARGAATRMAATLGEPLGERVGLRARLNVKVSARTRIEVITEGVFTRMILDDPMLDGITCVIFDEFHERSLDADLGLALALDAQTLREDLRILVMSATLDGARVATLLGPDVPLIESQGRMFPVETRYVGRDARERLEPQVAATIRRAVECETGSALVFLPGQAEIRRTEILLLETIRDPTIDIAPLYGAMDQQAQDLAVQPAKKGRRKIVLATSIAETSLTIEGVRIVVDSGLSRVPRYEPDMGVTRLETVRVTRASADQRRGRAGRLEPGICYRLWDEPQDRSLVPSVEPELLQADLSGLMLDLASWGVSDPQQLRWLDMPPASAVTEARSMLLALGAIETGTGRLTNLGRHLRTLPLPPRLGAMVVKAAAISAASARDAADLAALLVERGMGGTDSDLDARMTLFRRDKSQRASDMRRLASGWAEAALKAQPRGNASSTLGIASLLALAYPDRIARVRPGQRGQYLLANGRAAQLDPASALAKSDWLVVAEITGTAAASRILSAAALSESDAAQAAGDRLTTGEEIAFDPASMSLRARLVKRLDAIVLSSEPRALPNGEESAKALAEGIASVDIMQLPFSKAQRQLLDRIAFLRNAYEDKDVSPWPDLSRLKLAETAGAWLAPFIVGKNSLGAISADDLGQAMQTLIPYDLQRRLEKDAPTHFEAPTGSHVPVDYEAEGGPTIAIRVQELFGLTAHPSLADGRVPLVLQLLSPAHRPIQITRDLPGFWKGTWASVKTEMKGRYPRHVWPDDPAATPPTTRAKPRGT